MSKRVNWHLAASNAIQIDLQEYSHLLSYEREQILGNTDLRLDLLIIRKQLDAPIRKRLASDFKKWNLFEIKGIGSSVTIRSYYKLTRAYVGLHLESLWDRHPNVAADITVNFLSRHYPRNLIKHLRENCKFLVAKTARGIYDVKGDVFPTRIIVTRELPHGEYLFLRCLTNNLQSESDFIPDMVRQYKKHSEDKLYQQYIQQLITANSNQTGEDSMKNKIPAIDLIYETGEKNGAKRQQKKYQAIIDDMSLKLDNATNEIAFLRKLLAENGISVNTVPSQ